MIRQFINQRLCKQVLIGRAFRRFACAVWHVYSVARVFATCNKGAAMSEETDSRAPLFVKLGQALATWQGIELMLGFIFAALFGSGDRDATEIVYTDMAFSRKLAVIDKLFKYRIKDRVLLDDWKKLNKTISRLSRKRNDLVHSQFISIPSPDANGETTTLLTRSLSDIDMSKAGSIEMFKNPMDEKVVSGIVSEFSECLAGVVRILTPVRRHLASPQKSPK